MSGFKGLERRINQAEIHHLDPGTVEPSVDDPDITFQALLEPFELRPVGVQPDAEQPDPKRSFWFAFYAEKLVCMV